MRHRFLAILASVLVMGCATPLPPTSLIGQSAIKDGCAAVYALGNQLAIVTTFSNSGSWLTLYNPENGLFISNAIAQQSKCAETNVQRLISNWTYGKPALNAIVNPEVKSLFDNAAANSTALTQFIQTGPPFFRPSHTWRNKPVVVPLEERVEISKDRTPLKALNAITKDQSARMLVDQQLHTDEKMRAALEGSKEFSRLMEQMEQAWNQRLNAVYNAGDTVCTMAGNFYGNVEAISGRKVKVHVIGQVKQYSDGFFFASNQERRFEAQPIDAPRWFDRNDIGPCGFNVTR